MRDHDPAKHGCAVVSYDVDLSAVKGQVKCVNNIARDHPDPVIRPRPPLLMGPGRYDVDLAGILPNPPQVRPSLGYIRVGFAWGCFRRIDLPWLDTTEILRRV